MSIFFSMKDAQQKVDATHFASTIRALSNRAGVSLDELSLALGEEKGYVSRQLKRKTLSLALLFGLSLHLQENLFAPFLSQMPTHLNPTMAEKALHQQIVGLQQQIAALQQQLATAERERDLLKEVIKR